MELAPIFRKPYALGGDAKLTLVSNKTEERFTYQIRASGDGNVYFVSVLNGPDNTRDYAYLGSIFEDGTKFVHTRKSKISLDAPSARAFAWFWRHIDSEDVTVLHSGRCSRCNRELTTPESIERGLGPVCAERV